MPGNRGEWIAVVIVLFTAGPVAKGRPHQPQILGTLRLPGRGGEPAKVNIGWWPSWYYYYFLRKV